MSNCWGKQREDGNLCQFTGWRYDPWAVLKVTPGYERDTRMSQFLQLHSVVISVWPQPQCSCSHNCTVKEEEPWWRWPLAWHQRYTPKHCISTQTQLSWVQDGLCERLALWGVAGAGRGCPVPCPAAEHPSTPTCPMVSTASGPPPFPDFLEKTESGQLTFLHVLYLLPADFLACAQAQQQPDFAHPPSPLYFHG